MVKRERRLLRNIRCFTLTELLVVMIVMCILMGMMAPTAIRLFATGGVRGSAMQMQSVLLNARALAAKHNSTYAVVFNMLDGDSDGDNRDWEDCWYAVVSTGGDFPGWIAGNSGNDFNFNMVGPMYRLQDACGFLALSHANGGSPGNYFASGNPAFTNTSDGWLGQYRIEFAPDGSATFYPLASEDTTEGVQWITISSDTTINGNESYYDDRLAVKINKYTGLVEVGAAR